MVESENLSPEKTEQLIENYLFAEKEPLREELLNLIQGNKPTLLRRKPVSERILGKIKNYIDTFITGLGL